MDRLIIREFSFGGAEYQMAYQLRNRILRHPVGFDLRDEDLSQEDSDWHIGAFLGEDLVGVLILTPKGDGTARMRQVAVEQEYRGQGVGQKMVAFSEALARERGIQVVFLHARETASRFYEKLDYRCGGALFSELGIPHLPYEKHLY